jgi:hypothetical protein
MTKEFNKLAQEVYPLCNFLFEETGVTGGTDIESIIKEINLLDPEKWEMKGKDVKHAFKRYVKDNNPVGYDAIEVKFGKTFYRVLDLIPPFATMFVASNAISLQHFVDVVLAAPTDAQIIANFVAEDKFVSTLWGMYRDWKVFKDSGFVTTTATVETHTLILPSLSSEKKTTLDHLLTTFDAPKWTDIEEFIKNNTLVQSQLAQEVSIVKEISDKKIAESKKAVKELTEVVSELSKELAAKPFIDSEVVGDGTTPSGKISMKSVGEIFPILKKLKMDVPVWDWDGKHPDVPAIDEHYIFREDLLIKTLYAVLTNQRMYLQGHTGSGKTTLVEQVAAHLNWPFTRINFDSEITRMDLMASLSLWTVCFLVLCLVPISVCSMNLTSVVPMSAMLCKLLLRVTV